MGGEPRSVGNASGGFVAGISPEKVGVLGGIGRVASPHHDAEGELAFGKNPGIDRVGLMIGV